MSDTKTTAIPPEHIIRLTPMSEVERRLQYIQNAETRSMLENMDEENQEPAVNLYKLINGGLGALGGGAVNFARNPSIGSAVLPLLGMMGGASNDKAPWKNSSTYGDLISGALSAAGKGSPMMQSVLPTATTGAIDAVRDPSTIPGNALLTGFAAASPAIFRKAGRMTDKRGILNTQSVLDEVQAQGRNDLSALDPTAQRMTDTVRDWRLGQAAQNKVRNIDQVHGESAKVPYQEKFTVVRKPATVTSESVPDPSFDPKQLIAQREQLNSTLRPETKTVKSVNSERAHQAELLNLEIEDLKKQLQPSDKPLYGGAKVARDRKTQELTTRLEKLQKSIPDIYDSKLVPDLEATKANNRIRAELRVIDSKINAGAPKITRAQVTPFKTESTVTKVENPVATRREQWNKLAQDKTIKAADFKPLADPLDSEILKLSKSGSKNIAKDLATKQQSAYFDAVRKGPAGGTAREAAEMAMKGYRAKFPDSTEPQKAFTKNALLPLTTQILNAPRDRGRLLNPQAMKTFVEGLQLTDDAKIGIFGSVEKANKHIRMLATVPDALSRGVDRLKVDVGGTTTTGPGGSSRLGLDSLLKLFDPDAMVNAAMDYDKTGKPSKRIQLIKALASDDPEVVKLLSSPGALSRVLSTFKDSARTTDSSEMINDDEPVKSKTPQINIPDDAVKRSPKY